MLAITLARNADGPTFRAIAKRALTSGLAPDRISFFAGERASLLPEARLVDDPTIVHVPRAFGALLDDAVMHRAEDRFDLLYEVFWRIVHGERALATRTADPTVARLSDYGKSVRRDIHKMHAFVRFRETEADGRKLYVAWFEPEHYILRAATPFFRDRFANMDWIIGTPEGVAAWQGGELTYGPPGPKPTESVDGVLDAVWLTYYRTTFNPARLRVKAMTAEMPRKYWNTMPETALLPEMIAAASKRDADMRARAPDAAPRFAAKAAPKPQRASVPATPVAVLRKEAEGCTRCPLYAHATQTVFGEGPEDARLVFVGEQPGDQEDLAGRPFVGPAGQLLDRALREAGIDRQAAYLTNAVKHFKNEPRGKRRLHKRPNAGEVQACRWWLERELGVIKPRLIVALGATAAHSLSGHAVSVTKERGTTMFGDTAGFITVHPSFLLRLPDAEDKAREYAAFVADLKAVQRIVAGQAAA